MESLPAELLERILDWCDISSLKNLRLVNSHLGSASTSRVFEDFHMGFFDEGLQKLCGLAKSKLAKHVRSFTLYSDVLPNWDQKAFESRAKVSAAVFEVLKTIPDQMIEARLYNAWREFASLLRDQRGWRNEVQGLLFREHFSMLPNVATASVITLTECNAPCKNWWVPSKSLYSPDMTSRLASERAVKESMAVVRQQCCTEEKN